MAWCLGQPSLFTIRFFWSMIPAMDREPARKVIHVDMDAFFASVEQRDDPALRGRPVAVGSPAARGVVAAASYEARQFGVRSALPSVTALRRCPELVFVKPRFDVYRAVSRQIHGIFADYTSLIQPLSLDEAYLDVTQNLRGLPTAWATAREIRARILEETGLTASAGISYNNVWPAPSASSLTTTLAVYANVSGLRAEPWPRWRSARSGPHKFPGVERHML